MKAAMTRKEQLAYCAGVLDGEGCFYASRNEHCNTFRYGITVNMNDQRPLRRLHGLFGGSLEPQKAGHYAWNPFRDVILSMIEELLPFLVIKRSQAVVLSLLRKNFVRVGCSKPSQPDMNERYELTEQITRMKDDWSAKAYPKFISNDCMAAYAAGLVDAEGSIGIYRGQGNRFLGKVQMGMCDPSAMEFINSNLGGHMPEPATKNHLTPVFYLIFERSKAEAFCKTIQPYLTSKGKQAELVIRLQNHLTLWDAKRMSAATRKLPEQVIIKRQRWYQESLALNATHGRAETNPSHGENRRSDSPICIAPQDAELAEMSSRYAAA